MLSDNNSASIGLFWHGQWTTTHHSYGVKFFDVLTIALRETVAPWVTSLTRIFTRSQLLSLLSIARLNNARSRICLDIWSLMRMAQISLSFSGGFWPVSLPLFQGLSLLIWFKVSILIPSVVDWNQIMAFSSSKGDTEKHFRWVWERPNPVIHRNESAISVAQSWLAGLA